MKKENIYFFKFRCSECLKFISIVCKGESQFSGQFKGSVSKNDGAGGGRF